ncbi:hypothetical protein BHQ17_03940 [Mycolicibacterium holsaticum]|uniref:Uncharacterized protein n=1 Tax=Mycolicibacterium holsaticum TaxID=152142 RepID=A0A1E3S0Q2_9MYCO|nr:hypothetical protein BHQ17_03940 [Mycolicibacterium holsaticum]
MSQPDSLARDLGELAGKQHAGHLVGFGAAVAGGGGVTEDHQMQVDRHVSVPAFDGAAARGVHAVGARWDVPRLGNHTAGLGRLFAQQIAGAQVSRTRRGQRCRGRQGEGLGPVGCVIAHTLSLSATFAVIRVAAGNLVSHCGINSGIEYDSLIVELLIECQAKVTGHAQ